MKKDLHRRNNVLNKIKINFIYSVEGLKLNLDKLKSEQIVSHDTKLKKGQIGCYLSHYYLLNKISNNNKPVIILEDDIDIQPDFFTKVNSIVNTFPEDYDMILLSYNYYEDFNYKKVTYVHGCHCYIVNNNISKNKIKKLLPITDIPYDIILPKIFNVYILIPQIAMLHPQFSTMSNTENII
jgi:GR25 family glycosyltransferase involved in LPS biosynthesis